VCNHRSGSVYLRFFGNFYAWVRRTKSRKASDNVRPSASARSRSIASSPVVSLTSSRSVLGSVTITGQYTDLVRTTQVPSQTS